MRRTGLLVLAWLIGVSPVSAQTPATTPPAVPQIVNGTHGTTPAAPTTAPSAPAVAPAASPTENLISFDGSQAELRWENGTWVLAAGSVRLKDFGNRPVEAREALRLVRELRLNQLGTVGGPRPVMEYWLTDGQAPAGFHTGQQLQTFNPDALKVEQFEGHWCVRDGDHILFAFGPHVDLAQQALGIIQRYRFNAIGYVGQPVPDMIYFAVEPAAPRPTAAGGPLPIVTGSVGPGQFTVQNGFGASAVGSAVPALPKQAPAGPPDRVAQLQVLAQTQVRQLDMAGPLLPDPSFLGERVPFDWRQVQLRQQNRDWVLAAGSLVLANFGVNAMEARQALRVLEHYRFTEERRVGGPNPVFSYFLTNGQAPRGQLFGLPSVTFHPEAVTVRQIGGLWSVCEHDRVILPLRGRLEDAQQVLQIIQHEGFDCLCQVGAATPATMAFFVREH
jgi:hypothetical protein